ncbi:MAG: hypothetical protein JWO98_1316 [Frankiales bacterium]|nr:hypothetical protein [Frankiales bacterium]
MSPSSTSGPSLSRRSLLASSAAGLALLAAGCTSSSGGRRDAVVTGRQADALAGQVTVQEALVSAYAAAGAASPALGTEITGLASQAQQQLDRLKGAAPGAPSSRSSAAPVVATGPDPRAWLRAQVAAAADSHAAACLEQSGARAALLGSIAAGLRGQDGELS